MTYTFTYTVNTHSFIEYQGQIVITNITYTVNASRSDGKSTSFVLSLGFPLGNFLFLNINFDGPHLHKLLTCILPFLPIILASNLFLQSITEVVNVELNFSFELNLKKS